MAVTATAAAQVCAAVLKAAPAAAKPLGAEQPAPAAAGVSGPAAAVSTTRA